MMDPAAAILSGTAFQRHAERQNRRWKPAGYRHNTGFVLVDISKNHSL
jgi:hypothetical protein